MTNWKQNPITILSGVGLGGGIITTERGLTYNLETTYLELIRLFGLFGAFFLIFILIFPLLFYVFNKKHIKKSNEEFYFILAYFCYVFIIIPTNPLFLSSTGMLVLSITYSLIINKYKLSIK